MTVSAESLKNRDQDSWTELYERYVHEIFGFVSRLVNSKDVAEDLLQKIWLQAARGIDNFDPDVGEIRSWLFTVARRQVAHFLRVAHCIVARYLAEMNSSKTLLVRLCCQTTLLNK
jgi:RNA polymerase sigma factor (sigma-70 family)